MDILRRFNDDKATKNAVQQYFTDFIAEEGVKLIFDRKDTSHIADAKELIDKAFIQIEIDYGIQKEYRAKGNQAK